MGAPRVFVAACALLLAACLAPGDGQFLCDGPGAACPDGMACGTDGVCRIDPVGVDAGPRDGGPRDAGARDAAGLDAAGLDAALDAAGIDGGSDGGGCELRDDRDRDGACAGIGPGLDCVDDDATISPFVPESCPREGIDDDCDGAVDEGCPIDLGRVHPVVRLHAPDSATWGAWLSPNGLRIYTAPVANGVPNTLQVATRGNTLEAFGESTPFDSATTDLALFVIWLTADELELFAQATRGASDDRLYHATRGSPTESFGALTEIPSTVDASGRQVHPTASPDGLELYYAHYVGVSTFSLRRVTRPDRASAFGAPEAVVIDDDPHFVRMSTDARTLWFLRTGGSSGTWRLTRDDPSVPFSGTPVLETGFGVEPSLILPFVSPRTRELWFTLANGDPRGPRPISLFRAQLCRGGPCTLPAPIACDTGAGRVLSADGLRCYGPTDDAGGGIGYARDRCTLVMPGSRLTSVTSAAVRAELAPLLTDVRWIGAMRSSSLSEFMWEQLFSVPGDTREPFLWSGGTDPNWGTDEPSTGLMDRCVVANPDGSWDAVSCGTGRIGICALEMWPTW